MKKIITIISALILCSSIFAESNFTHISFVNFKNGLAYEQGEDCQTYTVKRQLEPFSMNKYETTYILWYQTKQKAIELGYNFENPGQAGSEGKRGAVPTEENRNQPVTMISWYDAIVWCNALSEIKGKTPCYTYKGKVLRDSSNTAACDLSVCNWKADGYRLPSEAEWEYAARRLKTGFQKGDLISGQVTAGSAESGLLYAWISENCAETRIVGTAGTPFDPNTVSEPATGNANGCGLFDMCGNVLEFCWDWYADYDEAKPKGEPFGYERVSRGGSWSPYTMFNYAGDRYSFDPNECYNYFGFRICCSISN